MTEIPHDESLANRNRDLMADADRRSPSAQAGPTDVQSTEIRMRRALGLTSAAGAQAPQQRPEQARQRHRFVQDGGVPVVMLNHKPEPEITALRERITSLEGSLESERTAHAATRRSLAEQHAAAQALQTRLAHAALAHTEALDNERRLRVAAQQALAEAQAVHEPAPLVASRRRRQAAARPAAPIEAVAVAAELPVKAAPAVKAAKPKLPVGEKPKRGRPRINPLPEPKPVRWWTPSFRAKTKA